jgi:hypothetical protein
VHANNKIDIDRCVISCAEVFVIVHADILIYNNDINGNVIFCLRLNCLLKTVSTFDLKRFCYTVHHANRFVSCNNIRICHDPQANTEL